MNRFSFLQAFFRPFMSFQKWWPVALAIAAAIGFCVWAGFYR